MVVEDRPDGDKGDDDHDDDGHHGDHDVIKCLFEPVVGHNEVNLIRPRRCRVYTLTCFSLCYRTFA